MTKKEKIFWENKGWEIYDTAWEAMGLTTENAKLQEIKFQMAGKFREEGMKEGMKKGAQRGMTRLLKYLENGHSLDEAKRKFALQ
ncbi:MAG: hypothetical protein FWC23_10620 [Chitinispirillia bacterium]|nr:hypothetical protein [Chitinispirillia bacterium]MCL2269620.1 hypothetical protein [Chitinispirillia bacterium]